MHEAEWLTRKMRIDSRLTPSLLARAFAGKLIPQDLTNEPAEKSLERIRQEGPRIARMPRMKKGKENP